MSLTKKTISGGIVRIFSLVSKGILQLVVLSFFTKHLTPEEFGIVNIITSLLVFIVLFTEIGLGPALIQKYTIEKKHISMAFTSSVLLAALVYLIVYFSSPLVATFYKVPDLKWAIRYTALSILFTSAGTVSLSILRRDMEFKKLMYIDLAAFLLSYGMIGVPMALQGYGLLSYITAIVGQSLISSLFLLIARPHVVKIRFFKKEFGDLFHFAGALTLTRIFNTIGRQGDVFTTGKILGMTQLGIYGRANQLMDIPNVYLGQALDNVLFPAMSKKQHSRETLSATYLKGISIINLFMFPLSAFIIILAPQIIYLVFGPGWSRAAVILQILCLVLPFKTSVKITDSLVRALGSFYPAAFNKMIYAVSIILWTLAGGTYGLEGIAIGVNISVLLNYIQMTRLAKRLSGFNGQDYYKTYIPGIKLTLLVALINIPSLYFLAPLTQLSPLLVFLASVVATCSIIAYVLLFHPKVLGPNWEWFLSHLLEFIPGKNRSMHGIKIFFLKKIAS